MARKPSRRLVALTTAAILSAYAAGYALTQPTADELNRIHADVLDPARTYRDGTYSGTGTSELGDVSVSLTILHRRIVAARITGVTTSYTEQWIDGLPGQTLARQSAAVDLVSGATYSSQAFQDAVRQALRQAAA